MALQSASRVTTISWLSARLSLSLFLFLRSRAHELLTEVRRLVNLYVCMSTSCRFYNRSWEYTRNSPLVRAHTSPQDPIFRGADRTAAAVLNSISVGFSRSGAAAAVRTAFLESWRELLDPYMCIYTSSLFATMSGKKIFQRTAYLPERPGEQ